MTQEEAKQAAENQNRFDQGRGCPFKSACIVGICPAFIPALWVHKVDKEYGVQPSGCIIVKGLEKLSSM